MTVHPYESLEMSATGTCLLLRDVKKPLTDGARLAISVMTNRGSALTVEAVMNKNPAIRMGKTRLEAFSDGVIAIIITIMVLELTVPHGRVARRAASALAACSSATC